jgi:hypothetical protein
MLEADGGTVRQSRTEIVQLLSHRFSCPPFSWFKTWDLC